MPDRDSGFLDPLADVSEAEAERLRAGFRLALALVAAQARADDAAIAVLTADCSPDVARDALRCATAMAAEAMARQLRLSDIPEEQLLEFVSARLMELDAG